MTKQTKLILRFFLKPIEKEANLKQKAICMTVNQELDKTGLNLCDTVRGWVKALQDTKEFLNKEYSFSKTVWKEYFEIGSEILEIEVENV